MYALFNYGGVYLDSDVEVLRSFNDLLTLPYFIGYESKQYFEAAVIGAEKGNPFIGDVLAYYKDRHFVKENGSLDIQIMPEVMMNVTNSKWKRVLINEISDFINVINKNTKEKFLDAIVVNSTPIDNDIKKIYKEKENSIPIVIDDDNLDAMKIEVIKEPLAVIINNQVRHDSIKTSFTIFSYIMRGEL